MSRAKKKQSYLWVVKVKFVVQTSMASEAIQNVEQALATMPGYVYPEDTTYEIRLELEGE